MLPTGRDAQGKRSVITKAQAMVSTVGCAFFVTIKSANSVLRRKGVLLATISLLVPLSALLTDFSVRPAQATTSNTLNFQGRLLTNTGTLVPDGTYNVQFNLYYVSTGGSTQWTETRTNQGANPVTIQNGYYSVYLGDTTSGGTAFPTNIDWSQDLYLGMTVRGTGTCAFGSCTPTDSEMTPRFKLTAVPYAFRAANVASSDTTAADSDDVSITTGDTTTSGTSGDISIDVGNGVTADGVIIIGGTNASGLTLGRTGLVTTVAGAAIIQGSSATIGTSTTTGSLILNDGSGGQTTTLTPGNSTGNLVFTLPTTIGNANECLANSGTAGVLTFTSCSGGGGDIFNGGQNGTVTIGSNDSNPLNLETAGNTRIEVQADGDIAFDTDTLFVDATNNRIGFGTNNPQTQLHAIAVGNTAEIARFGLNPGTAAVGDTLNTTYYLENSSGSAFVGARIGVQAESITAGSETGSIDFDIRNNGSLQESATIQAGGVMGIGDTTPDANLEVSASGNTSGNIFLLSSDDALDGDILTVTKLGAATFGGNLTINGNTVLGNATSDTITVTGRINSDVLPSANDTYNLGSDTNRWANLYLGGETIYIGSGSADEARIGYNNTSDSLILQNATNSSAAFVVNDSSSASLLTVDTAARSGSGGNLVKIGNSTGTDGNTTILQLDAATANPTTNLSALNGGIFYNSTTNKVSIIENGTVKALCNTTDLACGAGGGGGTLQNAYDASTNPEITLDSTRGALTVRDNATPISGNLLEVQNNGATATFLGVTTSAVTLQDSSGNNALVFDSTTSELRVYENISSPTRYARLYYDNATSSAVLAASSGTTQVGAGTGDVVVSLTNNSEKFDFSHTGTNALSTDIDFRIQRNITGTSNALAGDVLRVEDLSTFTTGSSAPNVLRVNQNNASATGNLILAQVGGSTTRFAVSAAGLISIGAGQSITGLGALTINTTTTSALTLDSGTTGAVNIGNNTSAKAITIGGTGANTITIGNTQTGGSIALGAAMTTGTITIGGTGAQTGTIGIGTGTGAQTISVGTGNATKTITIGGAGSNTINIGSSQSLGAVNIGQSMTAGTITIGGATQTGVVTIRSTTRVQIGSATSDATLNVLQLDSFSTFAESATCNATTNQGAMYYNTSTTSAQMRVCINGAWRDMASTEGLNAFLFGVVPDSGPTPGDLVGVTATLANAGPCKVYLGSVATAIRWTACTVYTGGRKQVVAAQTTDLTVGTTTANNWRHLCFSTAGAAPTLTTLNASETANLPTFSATAPILCLASIKMNAGGTAIGAIYDTRTFTTSTKQLVNIVTTAPSLGWLVTTTGTAGQYTPTGTTAGTGKIAGVVVATAGGTTANTINAIIATAGPAYIKSTAGTINDYMQNSTTAGYADTTATAPTNPYATLGLATSGFSNTCTANNDNCRGSLFTILNIR